MKFVLTKNIMTWELYYKGIEFHACTHDMFYVLKLPAHLTSLHVSLTRESINLSSVEVQFLSNRAASCKDKDCPTCKYELTLKTAAKNYVAVRYVKVYNAEMHELLLAEDGRWFVTVDFDKSK